MSHAAITVENLGKAYRIGLKEEIPDTLVGAMTSWVKAPLKNFHRLRSLDTFAEAAAGTATEQSNGESSSAPHSEDIIWALRDVSFEVHEGEVVGIIGRNGAGKSTLLKILSRITEPTTGRAVIRGRVSSLLEVGTGFHPELSGRENIYMNGTILGMSKREIDRKFDEIVDFSGVEKFLDTPIKRYSSGMKVRLAFSVAAHLEPEILVIDEVLAVGDADFQKKCLGKMHDVAASGRTVLFVSHNMPAVRSLTTSAVYLDSGRVSYIGNTPHTIDRYLSESIEVVAQADKDRLDYFRRSSVDSSPVQFTRIWLPGHSAASGTLPTVESGEPLTLGFTIEASRGFPSVCLSVTLVRDHDQRAVTLFSEDTGFATPLHPGTNTIQCAIKSLPLSPGRYTATAGVNQNANARAFDVILDFPLFEITLTPLNIGELDWPDRPWGAIHWGDVEWVKA